MGVPGVDDALGRVADRASYLIEGDSGSGKTTIELHFLRHGADHGARVLYVPLSESKSEITEVAESHGWTRTALTFEFTPNERSLRPEGEYSHFRPSEIDFQDTTQNIWRR